MRAPRLAVSGWFTRANDSGVRNRMPKYRISFMEMSPVRKISANQYISAKWRMILDSSVLSATTFRNLNLGYVMPHLLAYKVAKWASPSSKISPQKWCLLFKRWTLISQVIIFDHSLKTGRTYVYSLGCIFLIGCPNMTMFNTLICMDIHGEQIKRQ